MSRPDVGRPSRVRQLGAIGLYALAPLVSGLTPFVMIPAVTGTTGAAGWAAVATAMAIGVALSVIAELGWAIVGPQRVSRRPEAASDLFQTALASRMVAVAVIGPIGSIAAWALVDEHRPAAALLAFAVVAAALNPSWFFIGASRPVAVLLSETAPRVVLTVAGALLIANGAPLEVYGVALLASVVACWLIASALGSLPLVPSRRAFAAVPSTIRDQGVLMVGRGITTVYKSLPIVLVGVVAPGAVALYGAVDRPLRMGLTVLTAIPNRMQSWVGHPERGVRVRRSRLAISANAAMGVAAGTVFAVAMPLAGPMLFSGIVDFGVLDSLTGGLLVAVISLSRGCGLALVADDRAASTTTASIVSAAVAVVAVPAGALLAEVPGALAALVLAEAAGVIVQVAALRSPIRAEAVAA